MKYKVAQGDLSYVGVIFGSARKHWMCVWKAGNLF